MAMMAGDVLAPDEGQQGLHDLKLVAMREGTDLKYKHDDHLTSTSVMTDDSGDSLGAIKYLPFGECRNSTGEIGTDKLFTGQRLDDTGLYYYNARYYDPTIGRFISADSIVPDFTNPQSLNRYSYVINNPLSCIDPSGHDYVFICGSGGMPEEWSAMKEALQITNEKILIVYENPEGSTFGGPPWEIEDQVQGLEMALTGYGELTDIKLIGHSEGACAIVTVLDKLAKDDSYLADTNVRDELQAAVMLEGITGWTDVNMPFLDTISGWDEDAYNDLPMRLAVVAPQALLLDVWNKASVVHSQGRMPGWNKSNTFSYDSRPWWYRGLCGIAPFGSGVDSLIGTGLGYHNDPLTNQKVIDEIVGTIGTN